MTKLITRNLVLRTVTHNDIEEVARMWEFEKGPISLEDAKKAIDGMEDNHKKNTLNKIFHICFAIFESGSNKILGWCGLGTGHPESLDKDHADIFYLIDKDYRRKGYGTECGMRLLEYGFLEMQVDRINGGCAKDNIGSKKILDKIGMKNQILRENGSYHYFLTKSDYYNQTGNNN